MSSPKQQSESLQQLEWAVRFAQLDLKSLREGDWLNLHQDLSWFVFRMNAPERTGLMGQSRLVNLRAKGQQRSATDQKIPKIQAALLQDIIALTYWPSRPRKHPYTRPIENVSMLVEVLNPALSPFSYAFDFGGDANNMTDQNRVRAAFFEYLVGSGIRGDQLRACPVCSRVFVLGRRPRAGMAYHCNIKCSRNAATKRYRAKTTAERKPKERERSRRRYVAKQQRKYGPKIKVGRRPRRG